MGVELSRFVEPDLEDIADYIAQDNPERALSFLAEIRAKLVLVGNNPLRIGSGLRSAKKRASQ